jgi:hypothetical protein
MSKLHLIVEGAGDALAVPKLVHKVLREHNLTHIQTTQPQISGDIPKVAKRLSDFVRYALMNRCPILWVLDCDDKKDGQITCPLIQANTFKASIEAMALPSRQPIEFAFFVKEFETLFLLEEKALRDVYRLPNTLKIDPNAVNRRNAKGEIGKLLGKDRGYKETIDQAKLASRLDLATCRAVSRDFRHFEDAILRLCNTQCP